MRFSSLPLCLLAAAITSGCSTHSQQYSTGNPFDEPLAAPEVPSRAIIQAPPTRSSLAALPLPVEPQPSPQQIRSTRDTDVQVFALGDAPYTPVSVPMPAEGPSDEKLSSLAMGSRGESDEVLQEARRVGATGDVAGHISLLEQAGYMGNPDAFYELAKIYLTGAGVEKAPDAAIGFLNQAMNMGHAESTRVLGWLYVMGSGVGKDLAYGEMLLGKAAEKSVRAQREFGMALTNQRVPHLNDMERGLEYLKLASSAGDSEATKAYEAAFSPRAAGQNVAATSTGSAPLLAPANAAAPRQAVRDGGTGLEERGRSGDTTALYQYALNVSLGRIRTEGDPQFTAYCWYSVAAARGYGPAKEEMKSLAGIRTLADKRSPGRMDACIDELNAAIDGY